MRETLVTHWLVSEMVLLTRQQNKGAFKHLITNVFGYELDCPLYKAMVELDYDLEVELFGSTPDEEFRIMTYKNAQGRPTPFFTRSLGQGQDLEDIS